MKDLITNGENLEIEESKESVEKKWRDKASYSYDDCPLKHKNKLFSFLNTS